MKRAIILYTDGPVGTKWFEYFDEVVIGSNDDNKQRKNRRENIVVERGSDDAIDTYNPPICLFFRYQHHDADDHVTGEGIEPSDIWQADA